MGKVTLICVILVFAVLLEDGSSMRKRTEEEIEEDAEIAKAVNATLEAEEEEKKKQEEKKKNKKSEKEDKGGKKDVEKKKEVDSRPGTVKTEDKASSSNLTCPIFKECVPCPETPSCPPCERCPTIKPCPGEDPCLPCKPCRECPQCEECGPCPGVRPCRPCGPCGPDPVDNNTTDDHLDSSSPPICPEHGSPAMSVPVAIAVGITAGALVTGMATAVGLTLRYTSPFISGFLFLSIIILTWYLSSHHPEVARELGGRALTLLREAALALNNRVVEVLQRHREQVCFP
jgi:hypothetical protein